MDLTTSRSISAIAITDKYCRLCHRGSIAYKFSKIQYSSGISTNATCKQYFVRSQKVYKYADESLAIVIPYSYLHSVNG